MEEQKHKAHRKTKEKKVHSGPNPKAFAFANPGRLAKQAARSHDVREKKLHVPLVDRLPEEPPPLIVAVVGPPGVGKTTLIKSLIKRYTKHTLSTPTGPLTVVTSKRRRMTFLECPADSLAAMMDVAKVADIVLLMIDGNYGFEMETMEFLNVLAASGMPGNVFGILTHLDLFRRPATLRQAKKRLKHRLWAELYHGAKLFYLSGVLNGRYPDREVHNLSRFLAVMKNPRPLVWRNAHPYCLADRMLDLTPPAAVEADAKCDRSVALYGYLRGTNFPAAGARVHVPGVGDLSVASIESLPDPCPTPAMGQALAKAGGGKAGRRRLGEKQKLLYAPMSDVGGVLVDKDAVYIDVKTATFDKDAADLREKGFGERLVIGLQGEKKLLGEADDGLRLFRGGEKMERAADAPEEVPDEGRKAMRHARLVERNDNSGEESAGEEDEDDDSASGDDGDEDDSEDNASLASAQSAQHPGRRFGVADAQNELDGRGNEDIAFADSDSDLGSISSADELASYEDGEGPAADDDDESEDEDGVLWKQDLRQRAQQLYAFRRRGRAADLVRMIYDETLTPAEVCRQWKGDDAGKKPSDEDGSARDDGDDFFQKRDTEAADEENVDRSVPVYDYAELEAKWSDKSQLDALRARFISRGRASRLSGEADGVDGDGEADDDESEGDGEYEDLETGEKHQAAKSAGDTQPLSLEAERERNAKRKEELKLRFEEEDREGFNNDKSNARLQGGGGGGGGGGQTQHQFGEDEWYEAQKAQLQTQLAINRAELDKFDERVRVGMEGFRAGTYARIVLAAVPHEFVARFNPRFPVIVGGLTPTEQRFGFVHVRIKRHRWQRKILKTNDPLIVSLGWRRFQTLPVYSISDSRARNRMLKYTPEHMHCFGTFYAPYAAPNTGFCCAQTLSSRVPGFRIAATGVVLSVDESGGGGGGPGDGSAGFGGGGGGGGGGGASIVKKLKLTGTPYKIFRNTAFIRDMFSSALEVAKFEGAGIRTVSGIRGQIKRALSRPDGHFRATFEDKILMSDIVFLRAWYPVRPHRYYNPVTNLLDDNYAGLGGSGGKDGSGKDDGGGWTGMRLTGQVRHEEGLPTPDQKNSRYRPIERPTRHFNPLRVPRQLAASLPFKAQQVVTRPQRKPTYLQKRAVVLGGEERRARALLQTLQTLRRAKAAKRSAAQQARRDAHRRKLASGAEKRAEREKREHAEYWRREGKKRRATTSASQKGDGGGGGDAGPSRKRRKKA